MISLDEDRLLSEQGPLLAVVVPDTVDADLYLIGELDLATTQILDTLVEQQIAIGHPELRLDLTKLSFCDVTGLRALLRGQRLLTGAGGQLVLNCPAPHLLRVARLCGFSAELGLHAGAQHPPPESAG